MTLDRLYLDDFTFMPDSGPKPSNLSVGGASEQTATLTWTAPEATSPITGYAYQYRKSSDASWSAEAATAVTSVAISNLTGNTEYEFRVQAIYGNGPSTFATISFTTDMPLPYACGFENGQERWSFVDCNLEYMPLGGYALYPQGLLTGLCRDVRVRNSPLFE